MNKYLRNISFGLGVLILVACGDEQSKNINESPTSQDSISEQKQVVDSFPYPGQPIWGYRFVFVGDFDGNGLNDTLVERFVNTKTGEETNKFFSDLPLMEHQLYDEKERKVNAFLEDRQGKISKLDKLGSLGIAYGEVIGDVDDNGTDDIGIVGYDAYPSNLNTYRIFSFDKATNKWGQLFDFGIREMSLPQLPGYNKVYGLFGSLDEYEVKNEAENEQLEKALQAYKKVIKVAPKRIEFEGMMPNDLDYEFEEAFVFKAEYDEVNYWLTPLKHKAGGYVEYHQVLEKLYEQTMDEVKEDTVQLDAAMEYLQQVKFK